MCGRFSLRARTADMLAEYFGIINVPPLAARYNIAPSQPVPVVRLKPENNNPQRELVLMHWGLIPSWAKDPAIGNRMINARAETLEEKPAFRAALHKRRCLLVADGFYEWKTEGRKKQPYFFHYDDDRLFAFAGLWESWEGPDNSSIESCTIITTDANDLVRPIHDRMPVIIQPEHYPLWLNTKESDIKKVTNLLVPFSETGLIAYPVSAMVNSPIHDKPECLTPIDNPDSQKKTLF